MQNIKYKILAFAAAVLVLAGLVVLLPPAKLPKDPATENKLEIVASFYPLAFIAESISGNLATVTNITPTGVEPHDFEPSPRDIAQIYQADLFLTNGGDIDTWAVKLHKDLVSKSIPTLQMNEALRKTESADPHFWLDPILMSEQVDIVAGALMQIDPKHEQEYNNSQDRLKNQLAELDAEYKSGLANCKLREIVTSHDAFGYLARRYNFKTLHILGISPDEDPSPKKIAEIAQVAKAKGIKHIFFEAMASPKLSETIAAEIGASTLVLNPVEGLLEQDIKTNQNYISIMKNNLTNLKTAMICQ